MGSTFHSTVSKKQYTLLLSHSKAMTSKSIFMCWLVVASLPFVYLHNSYGDTLATKMSHLPFSNPPNPPSPPPIGPLRQSATQNANTPLTTGLMSIERYTFLNPLPLPNDTQSIQPESLMAIWCRSFERELRDYLIDELGNNLRQYRLFHFQNRTEERSVIDIQVAPGTTRDWERLRSEIRADIALLAPYPFAGGRGLGVCFWTRKVLMLH